MNHTTARKEQRAAGPDPEEPLFTPDAARRWARIPAARQREIVDVAWCGYCIGPGPMDIRGGFMQGAHLVLDGVCTRCRNAMVRTVSPTEA